MLGTKISTRSKNDITTAAEYTEFLFQNEAGYASIGSAVSGGYREKLIQRKN